MNSGRTFALKLLPWMLTLLSALAITSAIASVVQGQTWIPRAMGFVFVVTGVAEAARQTRRSGVVIPAAVGALILLAHSVMGQGLARWGWLPTWNSWNAIADTVNSGVSVINNSVPPAPAQTSLINLITLVIAALSLVLYWLICIKGAPLLGGLVLLSGGIVPMVVLDEGAPLSTFLVLGGTFLALLSAQQRIKAAHWGHIISVMDDGATARVTGSLRLGLLALIIAFMVPLLIPRLDEPVWRPGSGGLGSGSGSGSASSFLLDPEVSLRRELTAPDDAELLRYRTTDGTPNYMRIGALTQFDGTVWRRGSFTSLDAKAATPSLLGINATLPRAQYTISVEELRNRLLPVPYPALEISGIRGDWAIDALTATVFANQARASGQQYTVTAVDVDPQPEQLAAITFDDIAKDAPIGSPRDWLAYPADLDQEVLTLTDQVVANATSPYEKALAIQNWFRNSFTYSLSSTGDPSLPPLISFLRDRTGYCEQFAGAMAVMARVVGIPSRVAIGFTTGVLGPDDQWVVTAHDAHAWPELWFPGHGWVRFEPTPRADVASGVTIPAWAPALNANADQIERRGEQSGQGGTNADQVPGGAQELDDNPGTADGATAGQGHNRADMWRWWTLAAVMLMLLGGAAVPALIKALRIRRRVKVMRTELEAGLDAAWAQLRDVFIDTGAPWNDAMTPREGAQSLKTRVSDPAARQAIDDVVAATEQARFTQAGTPKLDVEQRVKTITAALHRPIIGWNKVKLWLLPASVIRRPRGYGDGGNVPQP